jgi:hypothetical protein
MRRDGVGTDGVHSMFLCPVSEENDALVTFWRKDKYFASAGIEAPDSRARSLT